MRLLTLICLVLVSMTALSAQKEYRIGCIAFYNFENLFDLEDDPATNDDDFTPAGANGYTEAIYTEKLAHLSRVVSEIGVDVTPDGAAILGVSEVENRRVLEDFVQQPTVVDRNYQIVHYDSKDYRGIDVALLYQPKYFKVTSSRAIPLLIYEEDDTTLRRTRDILFVSGLFDGEPLHLLVNHWPSRRGGAQATNPYRMAGAQQCKDIADSLRQVDPTAKIILMGDLNDDPVSPSVKQVLRAKRDARKVAADEFYNSYYNFYRKGIGTTAWRDAWSLFDQILLSAPLVDKKSTGYRFYQANIYGPNYLRQRSGHFKGYPFRTFAGGSYLGGYSDHFPVYVYLVKEI